MAPHSHGIGTHPMLSKRALTRSNIPLMDEPALSDATRLKPRQRLTYHVCSHPAVPGNKMIVHVVPHEQGNGEPYDSGFVYQNGIERIRKFPNFYPLTFPPRTVPSCLHLSMRYLPRYTQPLSWFRPSTSYSSVPPPGTDVFFRRPGVPQRLHNPQGQRRGSPSNKCMCLIEGKSIAM